MATRWGICSAGKISHDFTVALKTLPAEDHQVVAVAARRLADAQEFANKHSISGAYSSYEDLARDPDTNLLLSGLRLHVCADVVYIGVIHPHHLKTCLLFTNAKKHVLCEKPLAMNTKEVKEILDSAKKNNVFLMEAVWTRFFPASVEIRRLLADGEVGEVKMVRSEFCVPLMHVPRTVEKELGGGALLDVGVYCLQFICMVFGGEKPESIHATGTCLETGVDETVVVTLKFSRNRMAVFTCSAGVQLPNEAIIAGTKGTVKVPAPMWCPTSLVVDGKETQFPVPEPCMPLNFINSTGMRYEAEEVRQCLLKGLTESAVMSHADSLLLAELEDEIRRQVGVVYPQDCHGHCSYPTVRRLARVNMSTRWGVCSAGRISNDFAVALKALPAEDHQVVAVAARKLEDAHEFAKKHSISRAYGSYEELAGDPDIEVVYNGVIHPYHLQTCLLFTNAKKHVLCEKPLAMNTKEVKEILDSAKKNNVFLMEAVWTRFFPAFVEIRRLLADGEVGEVKMVRSEFGIPVMHVPRLVQKELGGGALLSIGMYCLQLVCMVYKGEKPESIQTTGVCLETGVDETVVVTLKFSRNRMAVFTYSSSMQLPNDAVIVGTKGTIQVPAPMWCPTSLVVKGKETQFPVPEPCMPLNFINTTGMRYEAEEVRQCLLKGLTESAVMSHADSLLLAELEDEIRRQLGVVYPQDCQ
ncbi:trans-1,2-dihydrobenzene-1,2-diol dehydrogenase [Xenentodon cancila]